MSLNINVQEVCRQDGGRFPTGWMGLRKVRNPRPAENLPHHLNSLFRSRNSFWLEALGGTVFTGIEDAGADAGIGRY